MESEPTQDWLELFQDGEIDRALERLAAVGPTTAVRDLRLHLQLRALALVPVGVLNPGVPAPSLAIDWPAVEQRWSNLTAEEAAELESAAAAATREAQARGACRHSHMQAAIGTEAEDLRVHLQLQELALAEAQAQAPGAPGPRLTIDWPAIARRSREMNLEGQRDLRAAALQAAADLRAPLDPVQQVHPAPDLRIPWRGWAVAAAVVLAAVGLYSLTAPLAAPPVSTIAQHPAPQPLPLPPTPAGPNLPEFSASATPTAPMDPVGHFRLPMGTLANLGPAGRIEIDRDSNVVDRLTQAAGTVHYTLGKLSAEVTLPRGQVTGSQAELSIALPAMENGLVAITVTRGEVVFYDDQHRPYTVTAGCTGYLSAAGAVQVLASSDPMPVFPLMAPAPTPGSRFHPEDTFLANTPPPPLSATGTGPQANRVQTQTRTQAALGATAPATTTTTTTSTTAVSGDPAGSGAATVVPPSTEPPAPGHSGDPHPTPPVSDPPRADLPPVDSLPPDELPPDDFTGGRGHQSVGAQISLPPTPEPAGPGNSNGNGNSGGNGNGSNNAGGNGHGFAGSGNAGLHLGQGSGGSNAGGNAGGNGNANGHSKIKNK